MVDVARDINTDEEGISKNKTHSDLLRFDLCSTDGMAGHSKCAKKGGGSFATEKFCACCDKVNSNIYMPKTNLCSSICDELYSEIEH